MNNLTPFSGLSLVVHLLVIGIASVVRLIIRYGKKLNFKKLHFFSFPSYFRWRPYKISIAFFFPIISVFILFLVAGVVLFSTTMAVKTGLREGASEPSRKFIYNRYVAFSATVRGFGEKQQISKLSLATTSLVAQGDVFVPVSKNVPVILSFDFKKMANPFSNSFAEIRKDFIIR